MVQACRELDLTEKPLRPQRGSEIGMEHLERHNTVVPLVLREIDGCHSTAAELAVDKISASERSSQPLKGKCQDFTDIVGG